MELIPQVITVFWSAVVAGCILTVCILPLLRRMRLYKQSDRKETMYGTKAVEFEKIRKKEEEIKRQPVPRVGGLILMPTVLLVGIPVGLYINSSALLLSLCFITVVFLVTLYDDLADISAIKCPPLSIRHRLLFIGIIAFVFGYMLSLQISGAVMIMPFVSISLPPVLMGVLFMFWCIFWQASSIIDGIDGLSGNVFLVLFIGTLILGVSHANLDAAMLSALGIGILVPWLAVNYAPAKIYLTETGMAIFIMLFATITFLSAGDGVGSDGLWSPCIFGAVLIVTWSSNILQLLYRKKTGKKLFRIAPIHHHFEAIGIPSASVVMRYTLATFLFVALGLTLVLL